MYKKFLLLVFPLLTVLSGCVTGFHASKYDSLRVQPDGTHLVVVASESEVIEVTHDAIASEFPSSELKKVEAPGLGWAWESLGTVNVSCTLNLKKVAGVAKDKTSATGWAIEIEVNTWAPPDRFDSGMIGERVMRELVKALNHAFSLRNVPIVRLRDTRPATEADVAASASVVLGNSHGTGFFVSTDGYLITNHHVIADSKRIDVYASNGNIYRAKVVSSDPSNDVALLKVEAQVKPLNIAPAAAVRKGAEVFTLGYPMPDIEGNAVKASFGRVNALSGLGDDIRFVQMDVPIQPGNSGGPLIADDGSVVGIVTQSVSQKYVAASAGTLAQNVNYAVKSEYFMPLLKYAKVTLAQEKTVSGAIKNPSQFEPSVVHIVTALGRHQETQP